MLGSDYIAQIRQLVHDPNASDATDATLLGFVNQARTRVALDMQCVQTYLTGLNTIAQQEVYPLTGFCGGVTMTAGGSGYTNPTVTFTGGLWTEQPTGVAVLAGGSIVGINMTDWGEGLTAAPGITITDPTGTGAQATAITGLNIINWLQPIDVLWGNLRINFDYLPWVIFNAYPRAYSFLFNRPGCFTVNLANQAVYLYPIPDQAYPMAITASILPTPLPLTTSVDTQVFAPYSDAVQLFAAHLFYASLQNLDMADYYYTGDPRKPMGKYDLRIRQLPASVTPYRIPNPYWAGRRQVRKL